MFLVYKSLTSEDEDEIKPPILSSAVCRLWYPANYVNFKAESKYYVSKFKDFLTQIIILTFLLKYYNNSQIMEDFDFALQDFYENSLDFSSISQLCEKYGRNISLKYVLAAYNVCFMFARQTNCRNNKNFYSNFSKNIIINKDFVNNNTDDIIDVSFDEFTEKYSVKILEQNKIPNEIYEMLHNSLAHVQKFDFIGYSNSAWQPANPYSNDLNITEFAENIFNKKFGLQTLYCTLSIGDALSYYYNKYAKKFGNSTTQNLVESRSEHFVDKIGNILNKLYIKNGDFTIIDAYLKLVQNHVRYALCGINKFEYNTYGDNERLDFNNPYCSDNLSGQLQIDRIATITKIRKLCRLLDYNIVDEFVKTPINMWETILDSKSDQFDNIMDELNLAIINCGNLALSTVVKGRRSYNYYNINFNINIIPPDNIKIIEHKFRVYPNSTNIIYIIPLFVNFYEYFNVVGDKETKIMVENRLRLTEQVEKCLENMKKLENIKQVKENIEVTIEDY